MLLSSERLNMNELDARLLGAPALTKELMTAVVQTSCPRLALLRHTERAAHAEHMIERGAWTDAALALLALELPQWQLRRLVYDNGEWHCALSSQRDMPEWLDQSIEAHHADLPMAILRAFIGVQQVSAPSMRANVPSVARATGAHYQSICCDNFD